MIQFPNAKINIGLNIVGRREDNYHNLETVMYPVSLRDALELVEAKDLKFTSSGISIPGNSNDNLCLKAYHLMASDHKLPPVHIHLHKHIPIGAGLGGGSSDASFLIKLINKKFGLNLSDSVMESYASEIGSDCAFFIKNKPVFAYGKGNQFRDIELDLSKYFLVLVMPPLHVSTAEAYRGISIRPVSRHLTELMNLAPEEWKHQVKNDFEDSVFPKFPQIAGIKSTLYNAGAVYASMSGSGASVYGIFDKETTLPDLERENQVFYGV